MLKPKVWTAPYNDNMDKTTLYSQARHYNGTAPCGVLKVLLN